MHDGDISGRCNALARSAYSSNRPKPSFWFQPAIAPQSARRQPAISPDRPKPTVHPPARRSKSTCKQFISFLQSKTSFWQVALISKLTCYTQPMSAKGLTLVVFVLRNPIFFLFFSYFFPIFRIFRLFFPYFLLEIGKKQDYFFPIFEYKTIFFLFYIFQTIFPLFSLENRKKIGLFFSYFRV